MRFIATFVIDVLNPLFVISLGLFVSLGYIFTLFVPVTISIWVALFFGCLFVTLIGLVGRLYINRKNLFRDTSAFSWRIILPLLPLVVILPSIYAEFADPTLQIMNHGDIHIGYIHQLLYGSTPVENVFLVGYPGNYYWLYHAYIATLVSITGFAPASIASALNLIALMSSLLWVGQTLVILGLAKPRTLYLGLVTVFVLFAVNIPGVLHGGPDLLNKSYDLPLLRTMLFEGGDRRLYSALPKFFNFSSTALGLMCFTVVLYASVKIIKGSYNLKHFTLISASGICILAIQPVFILYIVVVLLASVVLTGLFFGMSLAKTSGIEALKFDIVTYFDTLFSRLDIRVFIVWAVASMLLSFPLLRYINELSYSIEYSMKFVVGHDTNARMIFAALYPLFPFYIVYLVMSYRHKEQSQKFIAISSLVALILTYISQIFPNNQYKGVYIIAILMSISVLFVFQILHKSANQRLRVLGRVIFATLLVLSFSNVMYVSLHMSKQPGNHHFSGFKYNGTHIEFIYEPDGRMGSYYWIRKHTPLDSVVITPLGTMKFSTIFHERMPYVKKEQFSFTDNVPEYSERVDEMTMFYNQETTIADYQLLLKDIVQDSTNRPIYAIIKNKEIDSETMEQRGSILVYEHKDKKDGGNVYWLNPEIDQ
jgi:hypothetical protein